MYIQYRKQDQGILKIAGTKMIKVKKNKHLLSIVFLLIGFTATNAQQLSTTEVFKKVATYYETLNTYNFEVAYRMYKGHTGKQLTESYKASMYKNGNVMQLELLGAVILQFPNTQLTINDEHKTLIYTKIPDGALTKSPFDISKFLNLYESVSTRLKGNTLILEMTLKNSKIPMPYSKIIMHIDRMTYALKKQELFFSTKFAFVDKEGKKSEDVGRLEITFQSKSNPVNWNPKLEDYIVIKPNKKVNLANAYRLYTIIDQTNL